MAGPNGSGKTTLVRALSGLVAAGARRGPRAGAAAGGVGTVRAGAGPRRWCRSARRSCSRSGWMKPSCSAATRGSARSRRRARPTARRCASALERCDADTLAGALDRRALRRRVAAGPAGPRAGPGAGRPGARRADRVARRAPRDGAARADPRAWSTRGSPGLVITHELNLAARFADRILLLSEGRVVAEGTPREVLRGGHAEPRLRVAGGGDHLVRRLAAGGAAPSGRARAVRRPSSRAVVTVLGAGVDLAAPPAAQGPAGSRAACSTRSPRSR